ncbi:putative DNA-binding domain-containing protein [Marinagarivorans cellulosilyticus]|uniref:Putative DNA-binding domain-containing protein n=1 Tax=Marinagarivorans cellulosilyticus TaxID=2721545 RepID=A0AAN2BJ20_9GAMM|nr:putative DNA-binding domain-containing protein [Marinagarivorans cellulosilyticus]BCD96484.1 hypothetical protein MARGE09_P0684 [Marinagarivorans cellulosilyticus]
MASTVNTEELITVKERDAVQQLALRQNALIHQILTGAPSHNSEQSGVAVYRANLIASAGRALSQSYPVASAMLSEKTMHKLAARLLQFYPMTAGDWATWGAELARYLSETSLIEAHPYLSDIARVEWEIHSRSRLRAQSFDALSLKCLNEDLTKVHLSLSPSVALIKSEFHCGAIWHSHRWRDGAIHFDKALFEELLNNTPSTGHWLIQSQAEPFVQSIGRHEFNWIKAIKAGLSLDALLSLHPKIDFAEWFSRAIEDQIIVGLYSTISTRDLSHH